MKQLFAALTAAIAFCVLPTAHAEGLQGAVYHPDGKAQLTTVAWHRRHHRHHRRHYR